MEKSILITGASSGIGMASTVLFSQKGYLVFATFRDDKDGDKLSRLNNVYPVKMDVTNAEDIQKAFQQVSDILGNRGLYALINNAGLTYTTPFEVADENRARLVMEVNVMAAFKITQTFIPLLKKHNASNAIKSRVMNIASWAGYSGQPFITFYNASKAALIGLSESMYYDLGLLDIRVILASPGITKTPFLEKATNEGLHKIEEFPLEAQIFYKPYLDHYQSMSENFRNSKFFPTPEKIAAKLHRIIEKKTPGFKYNLAVDAILVDKVLTKLIPFRWVAAMNRRMFKLYRQKH